MVKILNAKFVVSFAIGFVIFILSLGSIGTVSEGTVGIKRHNGAAVATLLPGMYFKIPVIEDVVPMSVRSELFTWEKMETYSRDQQPTELKVSVQVSLNPAEAKALYSRFGTQVVQRAVFPSVEKSVKEVFGQYNAVTIVQERSKLGIDLLTAVRNEITVPGVKVEAVNLQNVDFSDSYEKSIEARMLAEVEVAKLRQNKEREIVQNQIKVNAANADADATRASADATAYAMKQKGDAEAHVIDVRGRALKENPALVALIQAERWDGKLPQTMVPGSAVPFVALK